jgi:8-oxo-dGTP pyrophosphatase MutT (NUDIX family)
MPVTAAHIRAVFDGYLLTHPGQSGYLAPVLSLLDQGVDLSDRREWAGHITASAVVFNPEGQLLLVHHNKYDKHIQPGGHLEEQDTTLAGAALRELDEETGVRAVEPMQEAPVHIYVGPVPARPQDDEQTHFHFDVRFAFTTSSGIGTLQLDEVRGAAWFGTAELVDPSLRSTIALMTRADA